MKKPNLTTNPAKGRSVKTSRRSFLRSGIAVTGGAAIAATGTVQATETQTVEATVKDEGYQVTEHVSLYYKSLEV